MRLRTQLNDLKIGTKLLIGFAAVAGLGALVGGWELLVMRGIQSRFGAVYEYRVVPLQLLKSVSDAYAVDVKDATHKVGTGLLDFEDAQRAVAAARRQVATEWSRYEQTAKTAEEQELAAQVRHFLANESERDATKLTLADRRLYDWEADPQGGAGGGQYIRDRASKPR